MKIKKYLPNIILILGLIIIYFSGVLDYLSYDVLKQNRKALIAYVHQYFIFSSIAFIFLYIAIVALSVPGASFLTIIGGFLFPQPLSTLYVVTGATIGASILFVAAKTALHDFFERKIKKYLKKLEKGFLENAASYLLFLRFVPLFPFWLVNLAPAFFHVPLRTFVCTTFIGIIPGSFVYAQAGAGLGAIFDNDQEFSLATVLNWQMRVALICLAIFSLIPIVIKKMRNKNNHSSKL